MGLGREEKGLGKESGASPDEGDMLALQGHMEHAGSSREEAGLPGTFLSAVPRILPEPVASALGVVARAAGVFLLQCRIPNLLSLPA